MRTWPYLLLSLLLALTACSTTTSADANAWHTRLARWLDTGTTALLLGEQHNAPEHQHWQRDTIHWLGEQKRLAAVVLEMADSGTTTAGLSPTADEADVRAALRWNDTAWPWQTYAPVIMEAVRLGVPVQGGNLPRERMHAAMQDAKWDTRLPAETWQRQRQAIEEGHCHLLPEAQITPMTRIQLARDASMAQTLVKALEARQSPHTAVVLIAGSAHVQREWGVPAWLPANVSLKIAVAQAGQSAHAVPADHIHPTPAIAPRDYCAELRAHMANTH